MSEVPTQSKRQAYIEGLFSCIAPRYDLLNTVMSLTRHKAWRRFAVDKSGLSAAGSALDVCCGTGDFAMELAARTGSDGRVVGVDFSLPMLELARKKAKQMGRDWVQFLPGDACGLPFENEAFDCVTVGFGLRNVEHLRAAITEMARVTRPGGKVISLEIVGVRSKLLRLPWVMYFDILTPISARIFSGNREAYRYLTKSVSEFMSREELAREFENCGLRDVESYGLACGAVCLHVGTRP